MPAWFEDKADASLLTIRAPKSTLVLRIVLPFDVMRENDLHAHLLNPPDPIDSLLRLLPISMDAAYSAVLIRPRPNLPLLPDYPSIMACIAC